ncbi:MAG: 4-alpha-glucanotransferase [Acidobacteriaceae bacterium]|nr:4-alpha-glucanotransferase [Acidobacteriaceae bacterium]MBV9939403.1 4-alpha-glucanotransferase [Acidobacteriaceae bacterium]
MISAEIPVQDKRRTNGWGIDLSYEDAFGKQHETSEDAVRAILKAMDAPADSIGPEPDNCVIIVRAGEQRELPSGGVIVLESGEILSVSHRLPPDLPTGYHQLQLDGSQKPSSLIVSPGKCWMPPQLQTWGWAVQLYAARSRESWGIGDFEDLNRLAYWSASELGAGMLLVNPLSAATPILPQQPSPYFPASRAFLNPLWLHIESIPGDSAQTVPHWEKIVREARDLNGRRQIDRDRVFTLKMRALEALWLGFTGDEAFEAFCRERGEGLHRFAIFCALAEKQQSGWHSWPEQYQHPAKPAVAQFAQDNEGRIRFYKWIQWQLDLQLSRCAGHLALMQDLPIGVDPDGADAWAWQDYFAQGVGVGAPPDEFNTQGQGWGLPPFVPHKLRASAYKPFIETIRSAFRHGGGLRIDHVMGLFRLFWVPNGMSPAQGAYVRFNPDEMLSIVALESERARAYVVGEDLGTVEEGAREKLAEYGVLSYRLLWFEKDPPNTYPRGALSAISTHDLPTIAGLWNGSDLAKQKELGLKPNEESTKEIRERLKTMAKLDDDSSINEVIVGAYRLLSQAPSDILTAALDDAVAVEERPNIPATSSDQNPNWSIALPVPIEEIMTAELPRRIAAILQLREEAGESSD